MHGDGSLAENKQALRRGIYDMISTLAFFIEIVLIIVAIISIIKKNHTVSIIMMCVVLFMHVISNWNFLFGLMLRINWIIFH